MRIGLLGGSFDPPHIGHLLAAVDVHDALSLDRIILIPAATQPLKAGQASATPDQRLAMVKLLADGDSRFAVDSIEIDRGGLSYTVDTLTALKARWPLDELFWLVGGDVTATFHHWREPDRIVQLATVVLMARANESSPSAGMAAPPMPASVQKVATRRVDVSSTEIRQRVRDGRSIRGFVPDAVAEFIAAERLYL